MEPDDNEVADGAGDDSGTGAGAGSYQLTADDAARLRDMGHLSPATYSQMFPNAAATDKAAPTAPLVPEPQDHLDAAISSATARKQAEDAAKGDADRQVAAGQAQILRQVLNYNVQKDYNDGLSPEDIKRKYTDKVAEIKGFEAQAQTPGDPGAAADGMQKTMGNGATAAPAVTLASDAVPGATKPGMTTAQAASGAVDALGLNNGLNMEEAAIREASKVGQAKATEQSAYLDRTVADNEKRLRDQAVVQAERDRQLAQKAQDLEASTTELAQQKIDPMHYWADKSTGDKVMAGIGLFLGAIGAGQTDGVNMAAKSIQQSIDKDIEIQKANYEIKKDSVTAKSGLYSKMADRFKDTRAAEDATRIAYLDNAKMNIEAIAARHGSAETKAKANMLVSHIEQKKDLLKASFMGQIAKSTPVDETTNPETLDKDKRERFVPGYGLALSKDDAEKMKTSVGNTVKAKSALSSLVLISNTPGASTDPAMRARAESEATMLQGLLRTEVLGPGTVNDSERAMLEGLIANPTKLFSLDSNNKVKLQTLMQRLDKNLAGTASGYGLSSREKKLGFTVGAAK